MRRLQLPCAALHGAARVHLLLLLLLAAVPAYAPGQPLPEPYSLITVSVGAGGVRPLQDVSGFDPADDDFGAQFGAGVEARRGGNVFVYLRAETDVLDVRQHIAVSAGARLRFGSAGVRPYVGVGGGVLWLKPVFAHRQLEEHFEPRLEARLGVEGTITRGFYWFAETHTWAAEYGVVGFREGPPWCPVAVRCAAESDETRLHLGTSVHGGVRIGVF